MTDYPEVVAWLTKKSREGFPDAAVLAPTQPDTTPKEGQS